MKRQAAKNTTGKGYFIVNGSEPLSKKTYHVRVPQSVEDEMVRLAGDNISSWLREAIVEKIERQSG